jgi:hypothetical protein
LLENIIADDLSRGTTKKCRCKAIPAEKQGGHELLQYNACVSTTSGLRVGKRAMSDGDPRQPSPLLALLDRLFGSRAVPSALWEPNEAIMYVEAFVPDLSAGEKRFMVSLRKACARWQMLTLDQTRGLHRSVRRAAANRAEGQGA